MRVLQACSCRSASNSSDCCKGPAPGLKLESLAIVSACNFSHSIFHPRTYRGWYRLPSTIQCIASARSHGHASETRGPHAARSARDAAFHASHDDTSTSGSRAVRRGPRA